MPLRPEYCRACGARIVMVRHVRTGKVAPVDEVPAERGNIEIDFDAGTYRILPAEELEARQGTGVYHTSHFATCPEAGRFRDADREKGSDRRMKELSEKKGT